jgi:hypothetical protein
VGFRAGPPAYLALPSRCVLLSVRALTRSGHSVSSYAMLPAATAAAATTAAATANKGEDNSVPVRV